MLAYAEETRWYASDSSGMALDPIRGPSESEYSLSIRTTGIKNDYTGASELSQLFKEGVAIKSWLKTFGPGGALSLETYSEGTLIKGERLYDNEGRPSTERLFLDDGRLTEIMYQYVSGRLQYKTVSRGENTSTYIYLYAPDGRLASVKEEGGASIGTSSALSGGDAIWRVLKDGLELRRYDKSGRLILVSVYEAETRVSQESLEWHQGSLERSIVEDRDGTKTTRVYAIDGEARGQETSVIIERNGSLQSSLKKTYDAEGRLKESETMIDGHLRRIGYEYDIEGTLLTKKTFYDGIIESIVITESPLVMIEELYNKGIAFVRVRYEDGRRVLEEILKDGIVVRSRAFE